MKLFDFWCKKCGKVREYLQQNDEDVPVCCGVFMQKVFTSLKVAKYRSGFSPPPLTDPEGFELDPKKKDIFGRYWDDLPDSHIKTREYWKKVDEFEKTTGRKAPLDYKLSLIDKLFGRELEEKVEEAK